VSYANYKRIASQRNNSSLDSDDLIPAQQEQNKINENWANDCERESLDCFDGYEISRLDSTNQIRPFLSKTSQNATEIPEWLKKDFLEAEYIPIEILEKKEPLTNNSDSILQSLNQKLENLDQITVRNFDLFIFKLLIFFEYV
jgi:hypothetical protein